MEVAGFLVEAGGDATPLLAPVDVAFNDIALLRGAGSTAGASTVRATSAAMPGLIVQCENRDGETPRPQIPVYKWFASDLQTRKLSTPRSPEWIIRQIQRFVETTPDQRGRFLSLLAAADAGISDVQVAEVDGPVTQRRELRFVHGAEEAPFRFEDESAGTRNWLDLLPTVLTALENGHMVVVEEIAASLHPLLTAQLIGLFQDVETNPHQDQLIFTTHDTSLLGNMLGDAVLGS